MCLNISMFSSFIIRFVFCKLQVETLLIITLAIKIMQA